MLVAVASLTGIIFIQDSRSAEKQIRIAVLKGALDTVVASRGRYQIINLVTNEILDEGRVLRNSRVRVQDTGIQVGKKIYPARKLRIASNKTISVLVGDHTQRYRGFIDLIAKDGKKLLVINTLELEQYVRGVLYHEITDRWPMQAMMAQAVAARTYAVFQIKQNKNQEFDVTNDIYSQVYGGKTAERYRTNTATSRTEGMILTYKGNVLPAYYHSNSGGHTEDVDELWEHDLPPLKGKPDLYSLGAPNAHWKKNFRAKDVQETLNKNGFKLGAIKEIQIIERTGSGRVKTLEFITRDGQSVKVAGRKFRDIIGPNELKSTFYDIEMQGYFFDVLGKGWGHGVGMSQWGANKMARKRFDFKEILGFYYPGAEVVKP